MDLLDDLPAPLGILYATVTLGCTEIGADSPLRYFTAGFTAAANDTTGTDLGEVAVLSGWLALHSHDDLTRVALDADALSPDASTMGRAARMILGGFREDGIGIEDAVMLDRMWIDPKYRGSGLLPFLITELLGTLRLDVYDCLIVTHPEPQQDGGGPYDLGPERDEAMEGLRRTLTAAGFEPMNALPEIYWKLGNS